MRLFALLSVATFVGCHVGPDAAGPRRALTIVTVLEPTAPRVEGEVGTFEVRIRNTSKKYVILRDLVRPDGGSFVTWQTARPGSLDFDPNAGDYIYERGKPSKAPAPAFNVALLCPGEEIRFQAQVRLLQLPRRFTLNYFSFERTQLSSQVYFETRANRQVRYRRMFGDDLTQALAWTAPMDPEALSPGSYRTVVFPHADSVLAPPSREVVAFGVSVRPRRFELKDAAAKAGLPPEGLPTDYTFYSTLGCWVLRTPKGIVMVDENGLQPLPEIDDIDALFFYLDTVGEKLAAFVLGAPLNTRLDPRAFRVLPTGSRLALYTEAQGVPRLLKVLADERLKIKRADGGDEAPFVVCR